MKPPKPKKNRKKSLKTTRKSPTRKIRVTQSKAKSLKMIRNREKFDPSADYRSADEMPWDGPAAAESRIDLGNGMILETRTLRVGPSGILGRLVSDFRFVDAAT